MATRESQPSGGIESPFRSDEKKDSVDAWNCGAGHLEMARRKFKFYAKHAGLASVKDSRVQQA
jgi:hypothetical protein